jgi:hypothetical protein
MRLIWVHHARSEINYAVVLCPAGNSISTDGCFLTAQAKARNARRLAAKPHRSLRIFSNAFSAICDGVVDHPQTERESKRMGHSCKPHIHRRGHPNTLVHA